MSATKFAAPIIERELVLEPFLVVLCPVVFVRECAVTADMGAVVFGARQVAPDTHTVLQAPRIG